MDAIEGTTVEDLSNHCGCCLRFLDNVVFVDVSDEFVQKFKELVQFDFISTEFSSSICCECDSKLSDFTSFKLQLLENQQNLRNFIENWTKAEQYEEPVQHEQFIEEYLDPEYDDVELPIQPEFYCDQCPKKFKNKRDLVGHLTKHTEVTLRRKFQCSFCGNSYTKNSSLRHHILMRHVDGKEEHRCDCGASFKTKLRLNYHKRIVHEKGDYVCAECNRTYPSMHNLKIHASHFHAVKSPCPHCGKLIAPGTFMKRHMKTHEPAAYVCDICSKAFTIRSSMMEHKRTVHQMDGQNYCENCGKSFGSKKVLNRHIERSHTSSEKTQCLIHGCSYTANRKDNFINHVKIHKDVTEAEKLDIIGKIKIMKNISW